MTIVLLASVSLFALVVTSRPIPSDSDLNDFVPTPSTFQATIQAAFQVHPGKDDLRLDAIPFHSQIPKQQIKYLSELQAENTAALASVEISPLLDETADRRNAFDPDELDGSRTGFGSNGHTITEPVVDEWDTEFSIDESPTASLVVLAFSCVAAFLALACIALTLYIIKSLRAQMLALKTVWKILPRFWSNPDAYNPTSTSASTKHGGGRLPLQSQVGPERFLDVEEGSAETHDSHAKEKPLYFNAVSDMESESGDLKEKYQDALDMSSLPLTHDLPLEEHVSHQPHFDDPALPSVFSYPFDQPMGPLTRGLCPSPASRPVWSVRAVDSPQLGLPLHEIGGVDSTLQPLIHHRRRAYRSAVPEFDIALAIQLRPGFSVGADPAWMVRFLIAIFGWFAVALTGKNR